MKKIKFLKWTTKGPKGDVEETTSDLINALINSTRAEEMPRGLEQFKLFGRLNNALTRAVEKGEIVLEEPEYNFVKGLVERSTPAIWAMNPEISKAIDSIINAEEVKV